MTIHDYNKLHNENKERLLRDGEWKFDFLLANLERRSTASDEALLEELRQNMEMFGTPAYSITEIRDDITHRTEQLHALGRDAYALAYAHNVAKWEQP